MLSYNIFGNFTAENIAKNVAIEFSGFSKTNEQFDVMPDKYLLPGFDTMMNNPYGKEKRQEK